MFKKLALFTLAGAFLFVVVGLFLPEEVSMGWYLGYLIGLVAVLMHLGASLLSGKGFARDFIAGYYVGLLLRFAIVLTLFMLVIILTKIDELSFTVSFIISYILHSVNEVIILNQKISE